MKPALARPVPSIARRKERNMTLEDIRRALASPRLATLSDHIDALVRPALWLSAPAAPQASIPLGASELGGQPDLPPGVAWPAKQGVPLSFVAQIRLEDAHPYDTAQLLPPSGLLSFFYDAAQTTYGTDPSDRAGFHAFSLTGDRADLQRQPFPAALPASARFAPRAVAFSTALTVAQTPALEVPGLAWSDDQQQQYDAALAALPVPHQPAPQHQLLGFPNALQDDMRIECQLASHGVSMDNAATDPRTPALSPGASNWILLLQLDSDEQAGMRWESAGMLYYWIERDALRQGRFDDTWVVLQSD
jgi:uncharacterized protein YwqG